MNKMDNSYSILMEEILIMVHYFFLFAFLSGTLSYHLLIIIS